MHFPELNIRCRMLSGCPERSGEVYKLYHGNPNISRVLMTSFADGFVDIRGKGQTDKLKSVYIEVVDTLDNGYVNINRIDMLDRPSVC